MRNKDDTKLFWKNVSITFSGTVLSQVFVIIGTVIIARIYSPQEFGVYSVWFGLVMISSVICTGRYEMALAIEKDGIQRKIGMVSILLLISLFSLVIAIIVIFGIYYNLIRMIPNNLLVLLIPACVITAINATWQSWGISEGKYKELSYCRIFNSISITLSQIILGIISPSSTTLAFGIIIGSVISQIYFLWKLPLNLNYNNFNNLMIGIRYFLAKHRKFLYFSLPGDSINTISGQLPLIIISTKFGPEITGYLAMTMRVLGAPIGLLGKSVLDVFKRHATLAYQKYNSCRVEFLHTSKILSLGSLISMLIFYFFSESIFTIVFGLSWKMSGVIAIWLLPMFALRFIASPMSYMFYLANKQNWDLVWQICLICMTFVTLQLPTQYSLSLQLYSAGYSLLYIVYIYLSYHLTKPRKM